MVARDNPGITRVRNLGWREGSLSFTVRAIFSTSTFTALSPLPNHNGPEGWNGHQAQVDLHLLLPFSGQPTLDALPSPRTQTTAAAQRHDQPPAPDPGPALVRTVSHRPKHRYRGEYLYPPVT
jgi:hypothetical protein